MCVNRASTEHQQSVNRASTILVIASLRNPRTKLLYLAIIKELLSWMGNLGTVNDATPEMSVTGESMMLAVAYCIIEELGCGLYTLG